MDNTQIRHSAYGNATGFYRISQVEALMELARADEREKIIKRMESGIDDKSKVTSIYMDANNMAFEYVIKIIQSIGGNQ